MNRKHKNSPSAQEKVRPATFLAAFQRDVENIGKVRKGRNRLFFECKDS